MCLVKFVVGHGETVSAQADTSEWLFLQLLDGEQPQGKEVFGRTSYALGLVEELGSAFAMTRARGHEQRHKQSPVSQKY
jgi:hypothetical protein